MTEEEAQYWSDYFMKNPPKTDPSKPGIFAQRKANRFFGMDNLNVNYLLTNSIDKTENKKQERLNAWREFSRVIRTDNELLEGEPEKIRFRTPERNK